MSGIPPIVPKTLRDEVYKIQDQLKILINNHKVTNSNHKWKKTHQWSQGNTLPLFNYKILVSDHNFKVTNWNINYKKCINQVTIYQIEVLITILLINNHKKSLCYAVIYAVLSIS